MSSDDPQFTAYAIDALPSCERASLEAEIWSDSELRNECMEAAAFAERLKRALAIELNAGLTETHWREIHAEAAVMGLPTCHTISKSPRNHFSLWAFPAAAGILIGAVIASVALTWSDKPHAISKTETSSQLDVKTSLNDPEITSAATPAVSVPMIPANEIRADGKLSSRMAIRPSSVAEVSALDWRLVSSNGALQMNPDISTAVPYPDTAALVDTGILDKQPLAFQVTENADEEPRGIAALTFAASARPSLPALYFISPPSSSTAGNVQPPVFSVPTIQNVTQQSGTGSKGTKLGVLDKKNKTENTSNPTSAPSSEIAWRRADGVFASTTSSSKDRAAVSVHQSGLESMRLDTGLYPTLEYLSVILEHDDFDRTQRAAASVDSMATVEQFHFRDAPDIKVNVVLDARGLPLSITPGNIRVLSISEPFLVRP